jgi:hypothetical protein
MQGRSGGHLSAKGSTDDMGVVRLTIDEKLTPVFCTALDVATHTRLTCPDTHSSNLCPVGPAGAL